jgi:hypothetical protein
LLQGMAGDEVGADDVDFHHAAEDLQGVVVAGIERRKPLQPGVVDQDVQRPRLLKGGCDGRGVSDVRDIGVGAEPDGLGAHAGVLVEEVQLRAGGRESLGYTEADAPARARDQNAGAGELRSEHPRWRQRRDP